MSTITLTNEQLKEIVVQAYSHGWHDGQDAIIMTIEHIDKGGDEKGKDYFYNEFIKYKVGDILICFDEGAANGNEFIVCKDPFSNTKNLYLYDTVTNDYIQLDSTDMTNFRRTFN